MAEYIISSGELESGIILENNSMTVLDGGTATDTTVNSRGRLNVYSGGTVNDTMVGSDGYFLVHPTAVANSATVKANGKMTISSNARLTGKMTFETGAGPASGDTGRSDEREARVAERAHHDGKLARCDQPGATG